ncbi:MAG: glycine zipper 2TM domain-containing protein [Betaproteobacteria bacterium]|nr:glycine zipper 2TM domain-containing protein [Betaproteobacteria bacterium]
MQPRVKLFAMAASALLFGFAPLAACTNPSYPPAPYTAPVPGGQPTACAECGTIESITAVSPRTSIGAGAIIGGIAGGLIGHQIGQGSGNTAATIAGAAGGALLGQHLQNRNKPASAYQFRIRLDSGAETTVEQADNPGFRVGDPVRIVNGRVEAR